MLGLWDESCANARSRPLPHGHPEDRRSTATAPGAEWAVNAAAKRRLGLEHTDDAPRSQRAAEDAAASATCTLRHRRPVPMTISLGLAVVGFSPRGPLGITPR